jgi:hypothetical protein
VSTAAVELEQLRDRRRKLATHRDEVRASMRKAAEDLTEAQRALARLEAESAAGPVPAKRRGEAERRLAEAEARRAEPWQQRLEGAQAALRRADQELRLCASENIDELVASAEQQVEPAVARVNALAAELSSAIAEAHAASGAIGHVLMTAGFRPHPNAVSRLVTEPLARAVADFVRAGGQPPVRLDRRLVPALAARDETDAEPATPVSVR